MDTYEFQAVTWPSTDSDTVIAHKIDRFGADGWSAVGMTTRATPVLHPGMGGTAVSEVVILLQRPRQRG